VTGSGEGGSGGGGSDGGGRREQATVATFDPETGAGTALTDDGRRVSFDGAAFAAGGLRLLRLGQRVRLEYAGDRVARLTIHTLE